MILPHSLLTYLHLAAGICHDTLMVATVVVPSCVVFVILAFLCCATARCQARLLTIFQSNMRNAVANLAGKTVRMVLPQVVYEALTHLIILKTIFTFFKGHSNLFINLLKKCNSPNPDLNLRGAMDEQQFLHEHYITDVSVLGGYSTQDIEYFIDLCNKIKDECRLDKICDGPEVSGDWKFLSAFVAPVSGAASPIARLTRHWASMLALPSSQFPMAMGVMSLLNEDSNSDSE